MLTFIGIRKHIVISLTLCFTLLFSGLSLVAPLNSSKALAANEGDWPEVSGFLQNMVGFYTAPSYDVDNFTPNAPIMGNGDMHVVLVGDSNQQKFSISQSDMWTDGPGTLNSGGGVRAITTGGVTIRPDSGGNLAKGKIVTASSFFSSSYAAALGVDGSISSKWNTSSAEQGQPHWLTIDLGRTQDIARWVVKHAGAGGEATGFNTADFKLQKSTDGITWVDVDSVTGNTASITDRDVTSFNTRYVRLYITKGTSTDNTYARIYEVELYKDPANLQKLSVISTQVTASSEFSSTYAAAKGVDSSLSTKWNTAATESGQPHWLQIDLGQNQDIARWIVKHAGAGGEDIGYNTSDFKLQKSTDGTTWVDVDSVVGNKASITDRNVPSFDARYVRLYITKGTSTDNSYARIYEVELYQKPSGTAAFLQQQDILNAQVTATSQADFKTKTYVSANENTMVTELWTDGTASIPIGVDVWAKSDNRTTFPSSAGIDSTTGILWATRESYGGTGARWTTRNAIATTIQGATVTETTDNIGTSTATFTLVPGTTVKIYTVLKGGKNATTHLADAKARVGQLNDTIVAALKTEHLAWWEQFWLKSYVRTYDTTLDNYYYGALYQFASINRAGFTPAGQYPFCLTDNPGWLGDFHLDQEYLGQNEAFFEANRPELSDGVFQPLIDFMPKGKTYAQNNMKDVYPTFTPANGILFPVGIAPWGIDSSNKWFGNMVSDASYTGALIIWNYYYNQDLNWLSTVGYPYIKALGDFWVSHLGAKVNGKYVDYGATWEESYGQNPIVDLGLIKFVMKALLTTSQDLGVDANMRATWQDIYDNISDYPTAVQNGKTVFVEKQGATSVRGYADLEFIYPAEALSISSPQSLKDNAFNTMDLSAFNISKLGTIGNKIGYPINTLITNLKANIYNQPPTTWSGLRQNFTIGGLHSNGEFMEFIQSSMLQSQEDFIRVFPNWYTNKAAKFKRLKAKGAFLVDGEITASGLIQNVNIMSEKGKTVTVMNPWPGQALYVMNNGNPIATTNNGDLYTFNTTAGSNYILTNNLALTNVSLNTSNLPLTLGAKSTLAAAISPSNATNQGVKWSSTDSSVAAVDQTGKVTAVGVGTATITVTTDDGAKTATCNVIVDGATPITTDNAPARWVNQDTTVTLNAVDDSSGVSATYFIEDGVSQQSGNTVTFTTEGVHSLVYWSIDNVGNVEQTHTVAVNIDKTVPETKATLTPSQPDGSSGWYVQPVTVTLNANDNLSGVSGMEFSLDGGTTWETYTAPVTFNQEGKYNISYRSTDFAGNVEALKTIDFNLDSNAPVITLNGDSTVTVALRSSYTDAGATANDNNGGDLTSGIVTTGTVDTSKEGTYSITYSVQDQAGNTVIATRTVNVINVYKFSGVLNPINSDGSSVFKSGRTVPVKFQLTDALNQYVSNLSASIKVTYLSANVDGTDIEDVISTDASAGTLFRYDSTAKQYIFNLGTKNLADGKYQVEVVLPSTYTIISTTPLKITFYLKSQ